MELMSAGLGRGAVLLCVLQGLGGGILSPKALCQIGQLRGGSLHLTQKFRGGDLLL